MHILFSSADQREGRIGWAAERTKVLVSDRQKPGPTRHRRTETGKGQMIVSTPFEKDGNAMKATLKALVAASGLIALTAGTASAQNMRNCAPRDAVVDRLASGYGEARQSMGLGANNQVVEVFASAETGTWTITVTMPNGLTCLVASGQAFEELAEVLPEDGNDA